MRVERERDADKKKREGERRNRRRERNAALRAAAMRPCALCDPRNLSEFTWRRDDKTCALNRERSSLEIKSKGARSREREKERTRKENLNVSST